MKPQVKRRAHNWFALNNKETKSMKKVYIAGPMTGIKDFNRPAFFEMAKEIECTDAIALNPAILPGGLKQSEYMDICFAMVRAANAVVFLDGWEGSEGAQAEYAYAKKLGLPLYQSDLNPMVKAVA